MDLDRVVSELGIGESQELLALEWESFQCGMPDREVSFLSPAFVKEACRGIYLPEEITGAAVDAARQVAGSPALCALAWHCHRCLYCFEGYPNQVVDRWPCLKGVLGDAAGLFYLLVLLSWFPQMRAVHQAHALPEPVVRESMNQIYQRGLAYSETFGRWGLDGHAARWLSNYLRGEIYALGRLMHQFSVIDDRIQVYRRRESSVVIALSEDGVSYRADGQLFRGGDTERAWTSRLVVTEREIVGHPILPTGCAVEKEVALPASEWVPLFGRGDPVLSFHIPGGIPLDHGLCGESFRAAMAFFPRHFPERPYKAFYCSSWLLDTQLEQWLQPSSNLVRFLQEFYLFPGGISEASILHAVFGGVPEDLSRASRETTLQRAILDHMSEGKRIDPSAGKCFLFPEDLDWGAQVYRTSKFPWNLIGG